MPDKPNDQSNDKPIEDVDFDLETSPLFPAQENVVKSDKLSPLVWISLAVLIIIALGVVFVLPTIVEEYELPLEKRVQVSPSLPGARPAQELGISPFELAQQAIHRKEAQDVLASLLELQADLDAIEVDSWGGEVYREAISFAEIGDGFYREQAFIEARDSYSQGLNALQNIIDTTPEVLVRLLQQGQIALEVLDAQLAAQYFSQALLLDIENSLAMAGLARAKTLDEVGGLISRAQTRYEGSELEAALELYEQAFSLDPQYTALGTNLNRVKQAITENEFSQIMSEGYALLENEQPELAINAFRQASNLGIRIEQALAAITQTENQISSREISTLQGQISSAEIAEQWAEAVSAYKEVLSVDGNLVFAINGKDYAEKRLRLDQLLEASIAAPERFADDEVYQQTLDIYYTGRAIEEPGDKLVQQLTTLQELLDSSQQSISVQLISNNETQVSLLRSGGLGLFQRQSISLKPGRYVLVGQRQGYRDVRTEFMVGFGQTPTQVLIQCDEKIIASRGR